MGRETVTTIVLIDIQIDAERDARKVAQRVREDLLRNRRGTQPGGFPGWKPKVRHERGRKKEPHTLEVEFTVPSDPAMALIKVCASPSLSKLLSIIGDVTPEDVTYMEAVHVRE